MDSTPPPLLGESGLFHELRSAVEQTLKRHRQQSERALRRPITVARLHYMTIVVGGYLVGLVSIVINLTNRLQPIPFFNYIPWLIMYAMSAAVWTLATAIPSGWIYSRLHAHPLPLLTYTLLVFPLLIEGIDRLVNGTLSAPAITLLVLPGMSLAFLMGLLSILVTISGGFPEAIYLFILTLRSTKHGLVFPSYEHILRDAVSILETTEEWKRVTRDSIDQTRYRSDQARRSAFGTLQIAVVVALFSVILLIGLLIVVPQDILLSTLIAGTVSVSYRLLLSGILLAILLGSIVYTLRIFCTLFVLDAVAILCGAQTVLLWATNTFHNYGPNQGAQGMFLGPVLFHKQPDESNLPSNTKEED